MQAGDKSVDYKLGVLEIKYNEQGFLERVKLLKIVDVKKAFPCIEKSIMGELHVFSDSDLILISKKVYYLNLNDFE